MSVWLVTGGSGFLGRHLLDLLNRSPRPGTDIVALGRRVPEGWPPDAFVPADLDDPPTVSRAVDSVRPDVVFHLAGRTSSADVGACFRANVGGTAALVGALECMDRPCRVVAAGSAAELGPVPDALLPAGDRTPCRPEGPYGLSKWFASRLVAGRNGPVEGLVARIFNPIGPGMPRGQAFGRFAAVLAAPGPDPVPLRTGDLDARRDFIDARDVASALIALADRGRAGAIYHVGTGASRRVGEGLDRLVALSGRRVAIECDPSPARPRDSRADIGAIVRDTDWSPRIAFDDSLADLWASAVAACSGASLRADAASTLPQPRGLAGTRPPRVASAD